MIMKAFYIQEPYPCICQTKTWKLSILSDQATTTLMQNSRPFLSTGMHVGFI